MLSRLVVMNPGFSSEASFWRLLDDVENVNCSQSSNPQEFGSGVMIDSKQISKDNADFTLPWNDAPLLVGFTT